MASGDWALKNDHVSPPHPPHCIQNNVAAISFNPPVRFVDSLLSVKDPVPRPERQANRPQKLRLASSLYGRQYGRENS